MARTSDRDRILNALTNAGGRMTNAQAMAALKLRPERYEVVKADLLNAGLIEKQPGPGGGIRLKSTGSATAAAPGGDGAAPGDPDPKPTEDVGPPTSADGQPPGAHTNVLMSVLQAAIVAVPAVKYALGVAGVGAAVALIGSIVNLRIAFVGVPVMLLFMVVLVVVGAIARMGPQALRLPARVLSWFLIALFMLLCVTLFTSFAFMWPRPLHDLLSAGTMTTQDAGAASSSSSSAAAPRDGGAAVRPPECLPPPQFQRGGAEFRVSTARDSATNTRKRAGDFKDLLKSVGAGDWVGHVSEPVAGTLEGDVQMLLILDVQPSLLTGYCNWIQCSGWDTGLLPCEQRIVHHTRPAAAPLPPSSSSP